MAVKHQSYKELQIIDGLDKRTEKLADEKT